MRFLLHYEGDLFPAKQGSSHHKHDIRRAIHPQLAVLWDQWPLSEIRPTPGEFGFRDRDGKLTESDKNLLNWKRRKQRRAFTFIPVILSDLKVTARLNITLIRPGRPGNLVRSGGDIDNRIKTLIDALTVPTNDTAIPSTIEPTEAEKPWMYTVLEDDGLVTDISIRTEQLLRPSGEFHVVALVEVETDSHMDHHWSAKFR